MWGMSASSFLLPVFCFLCEDTNSNGVMVLRGDLDAVKRMRSDRDATSILLSSARWSWNDNSMRLKSNSEGNVVD